jgi:hypothetical protein
LALRGYARDRGLGVSIFIALFIIYVYDPTLFEIWVRRLFFD